MGNKFNAAAFFGGMLPAAVNTGAQAYAGKKRMKLEQEQQDWYKKFLEKNAEESNKNQAVLTEMMKRYLGFDPSTGQMTPSPVMGPQVQGSGGSILSPFANDPNNLFGQSPATTSTPPRYILGGGN
jgi:hypothetical protein